MKPRSTVTALLAMTESLLAERAARAARTKPARTIRTTPRASGIVRLLSRSLFLRIKPQAIS